MKRTIAITLSLGLFVALAIFFSTHHRVYGNCKNTIEGKVCSLIKWERNK